MGNLTKNFSFHEFAVSDSFPELVKGIKFTTEDKHKIFYLCSTILQPIRDEFGPVRILSGKRSPALNQLVGGSETSDHLFMDFSCAADFCTNADLSQIQSFITTRCPTAFGQLIVYPRNKFIHVSLPTLKHHSEVFEKYGYLLNSTSP